MTAAPIPGTDSGIAGGIGTRMYDTMMRGTRDEGYYESQP